MLVPLDRLDWADIAKTFAALESRARLNLGRDERPGFRSIRRAMARYAGQTHEVLVDVDEPDSVELFYERFQAAHEALFGTRLDDPAEIVSVHVTVMTKDGSFARGGMPASGTSGLPPRIVEHRPVHLFGSDVAVYAGPSLTPGSTLAGPALVEEIDTVITVPLGAGLSVEADGTTFVLQVGAGG